MNTANLPQKADYKPLVLVDTADLPREEWLAWRRKGIGGSDVAAIMGISPFRTARDIYYDKLNITPGEENDSNWVAKEMGHLLEDLVAEIFHKKTGYEVYQVKKMFYHPQYPFMLADVDYFVKMPDGTTAILEIKTTNYNAKDNWWLDGKKIVPVYYEVQGRHYMAVTNIDRVFFCCLYGNTEDEVIIREIVRDIPYEEEMIFLEQNFWENHVTPNTPPPYLESGELAMQSVLSHIGPADKSAPTVMFGAGIRPTLQRYVELNEEYRRSDKHTKKLESDLKLLRATLIAEMGESCTALYEQDGYSYVVTANPVSKPGINKDNLSLLELEYPELYKRYVTVSKWRNFKVKVTSEQAA